MWPLHQMKQLAHSLVIVHLCIALYTVLFLSLPNNLTFWCRHPWFILGANVELVFKTLDQDRLHKLDPTIQLALFNLAANIFFQSSKVVTIILFLHSSLLMLDVFIRTTNKTIIHPTHQHDEHRIWPLEIETWVSLAMSITHCPNTLTRILQTAYAACFIP